MYYINFQMVDWNVFLSNQLLRKETISALDFFVQI